MTYWGYDRAFKRICEAEPTLSRHDLDRDAIVVAIDGPHLLGV